MQNKYLMREFFELKMSGMRFGKCMLSGKNKPFERGVFRAASGLFMGSLLLVGSTLLVGCGSFPGGFGNGNRAEQEVESLGGEQQSAGQGSGQGDLSEQIPVASWDELSAGTENAMLTQVAGDAIYTAAWAFDYDKMRKTNCIVNREDADGSVQTIATFEEEQMEYFLVGQDGAVYYLYTVKAEEMQQCYLRKDSAEGETLYDNLLCEVNVEAAEKGEIKVEEPKAELSEVDCGVVTEAGELCLMGFAGKVFLVDAEGENVTVLETGRERLADTDAEGIVYCEGKPYLYLIEGGQAALRPVDMEKAIIGANTYLSVDSGQLYGVFSGFEKGVYLMDPEGLWNYNFAGNSYSQAFQWEDKNIGVNPVFVEYISAMQDGRICILYENLTQKVLARILVEQREASEVAAKQNVTLGVTLSLGNDGLEAMVQKFNLQSERYRIQIVDYGKNRSKYREDLLLGQGTDLYELSAQSMEQLTRLGVLEDLKPYFATSEVVKEEDILACIREAGEVDGKLVGIAPEFYLHGLIVPKGTTDKGAWTPEEFLALQEKYPDARLDSKDETPMSALLWELSYEVSCRIDWEERTCDFDSESFQRILEGLYQNSQRKFEAKTAENDAELLYKKEQLVLGITIPNPWGYVHFRDAFEGFGELAGFPNSRGDVAYRMYADEILGINSASACKEGAWSFLEFWLSEERQWQTNDFPARADVFDEMLALDVSPRVTEQGNIDEEMSSWINQYSKEKTKGFQRITDADREAIRYMVENARYGNAMKQEMIQTVLFEELQAYFAGDKTVEAVMDIIQNRISLYLDEME